MMRQRLRISVWYIYFYKFLAKGVVQEDIRSIYMEMSALITRCPLEVNLSPVMQNKALSKFFFFCHSHTHIPLDKWSDEVVLCLMQTNRIKQTNVITWERKERARHSVREAEGKIKSKQPLSTKLYSASTLCLSVSEWVMMIAINQRAYL